MAIKKKKNIFGEKKNIFGEYDNIDNLINKNGSYFLERFSINHKNELSKEEAYKLVVKGNVAANIFMDDIANDYARELITYATIHEDSYIFSFYFEENNYNGDYNKLIIDSFNSILNTVPDNKDKLLVFGTNVKKYCGLFIVLVVNSDKLSIDEKSSILKEFISSSSNIIINDDFYEPIKQFFKDDQIILIDHLKNPKLLYKDVILSRNKKDIAYYIYKAKDADLLIKLFGDSEKYSNYCARTFNKQTNEIINEWIKEEIDFKYVDSNIEDLINSGNEPLVK